MCLSLWILLWKACEFVLLFCYIIKNRALNICISLWPEEYNNFLVEKGKEEVDFDKKFTEEEYAQLIDVNSSNDIDINGTQLDALSFLEVIYALFVE